MSEPTLREVRLQKLERLKELGLDPFKVERFTVLSTVSSIKRDFKEQNKVQTAGRIVAIRQMGKAAFLVVTDGDERIQLYLRKDELPEPLWEGFLCLDLGDHIGLKGTCFVTKTAEPSIHVSEFLPLSKALQPPPIPKEKEGESFSALSDADTRLRHRHLDLIANREVRKALLDRSRIVAAVRKYFIDNGFLEVETPMLQTVAGGAAARPFLTHYNAYDVDVKLRISLELYLKMLICGDVPKVFELGRVFRNEGVSSRHNPEFTLVEWYEAYANLEDQMTRVEELFRFVCREVYGTETLTDEKGTIDFGQPWERIDLVQSLVDAAGMAPDALNSLDSAKAALEAKGLPSEKETTIGGIAEKLLEKFVEPSLQSPCFVVGYPIDTSPLAKKDPNRPGFTRRFEGYIRGREICNAFSELNDPIDQRERFENQVRERAKGDDEAHPMDEDYLFALETGMPPTGGVGIGIDRLVMLLTGRTHLRESLLYPMMKPENTK